MDSKERELKNIEGKIETIQQLSIECIEHIYLAAYNEAVEAAAKCAEMNNNECRVDVLIRKLKK